MLFCKACKIEFLKFGKMPGSQAILLTFHQDGVLCVTEELLRMYVQSIQDVLKAEMEIYSTISPEEWDLLKPKPWARMADIMNRLKKYLRLEGQCGNCVGWAMKSAELVDIEVGANMVDVGNWEPMQGLTLRDDLFPHVTGGLRGRVLTVAAIDVNIFI